MLLLEQTQLGRSHEQEMWYFDEFEFLPNRHLLQGSEMLSWIIYKDHNLLLFWNNDMYQRIMLYLWTETDIDT